MIFVSGKCTLKFVLEQYVVILKHEYNIRGMVLHSWYCMVFDVPSSRECH